MILRREHLGQHPSVFRSMTGLTVEAFDAMLPELLDAFHADRRRRLDRPGRRRAFGVGDSSALRAARRCLPVLEAAGKDTMRLPGPGRGKRRDLPALLRGTPALA